MYTTLTPVPESFCALPVICRIRDTISGACSASLPLPAKQPRSLGLIAKDDGGSVVVVVVVPVVVVVVVVVEAEVAGEGGTGLDVADSFSLTLEANVLR